MFAATATAALLLPGATVAAADQPIVVDRALDECVKTHLAAEGLTADEVERLTALTCDSEGIASLEGIQQLSGLTSLRLTVQNGASVNPLESLPDLNILVLKGFEKQDFSGLKNLTTVTSFDISESPGLAAEDLAFVGEMTQLKSLTLRGNELVALPDFEPLVELETLRVERNQLTTLDGLQRLPRLLSIEADRNHVAEVSVFEETGAFPRLSRVSLNFNRVTNTTPVSALPALEHAQFAAQIIRLDATPLNTWNQVTLEAAIWGEDGPASLDLQPRPLRGEGLEVDEDTGAWQMTSPGTFLLGWYLPDELTRTPFSGVIVQSAESKAVEEEPGVVTVWHLDEANNELAAPELLSGEIGSEYIAPGAKEIPGYDHLRTEGVVSGTFAKDPITIVHVYGPAVIVDPEASVVSVGADQRGVAGQVLTFEVSRVNAVENPWTGEASVQVSTANGSAVAGVDFEAVSARLVWAAEDTAVKSVVVASVPAGAGAVASEKSFEVVLTAPGEFTELGERVSAAGTIVVAEDEVVPPKPQPEVIPEVKPAVTPAPEPDGKLADSGQSGSALAVAAGAAAFLIAGAGLLLRRRKG